ncbi:hypothetical protein B1M_06535, partial [Burkholderia sp. TJI49]
MARRDAPALHDEEERAACAQDKAEVMIARARGVPRRGRFGARPLIDEQ